MIVEFLYILFCMWQIDRNLVWNLVLEMHSYI